MVIDGRAISNRIIAGLKKRKRPPGFLAAILVGKNAASEKFLKEKARVASELNIPFRLIRLPGSVSVSSLLNLIARLNRDPKARAIVLQLPLPSGIKTEAAIAAIDPRKDIDALGSKACVLPPAVGAVRTILAHVRFSLRGKRAVVLGRGVLVGGPVAEWLGLRVAELAQFHRSYFDRKKLRQADLVISGAGKPGLIRGDDLKKGAICIDFGYGMKRGKVSGDFDFQSSAPKAGAITPTPGGTGPILVAELFRNFFEIR